MPTAPAATAPPAPLWPKTCSCSRSYTAEQWEALPDRKVWRIDAESTLELRNCVCRSTMAIEISLSNVLLGVHEVAA